MEPTAGKLFVKKADKKQPSAYEVVDNTEARYEVTQANDVTVCKVGDFVLFTDYKTYKFDGEDIFVVNEGDIVGVKHAH